MKVTMSSGLASASTRLKFSCASPSRVTAKADPRRCVPGAGCLTICGLRDGIAAAGQFCIATRLAYALHGDVRKGLFFRGSEPLAFGSAIRPVRELVDYLLTGNRALEPA
jgi:nitronate monooxygenase